MTVKLFYAHILRAVSQPNLAERSSRNQRLVSPSLSCSDDTDHGSGAGICDVAKIESEECHLRWRKGNSAWGKGLDRTAGVCDRDARVGEKGASLGRWRGNGDIFEGRHCCSHRVSGSIDLRLGCVPTRANSGSSPVHSGAAGELCCVPFQSCDLNACGDKLQQIVNKCCMGIYHCLTSSETLAKACKSSPVYLFSSEFDQNLWRALFIESPFFFFELSICTSIPMKNVWQISRFHHCFSLMVVSLCNFSIGTSYLNHAHPVILFFLSVKQNCFINHPKSPFIK